ncbi:MAG: hypothetical protein ACT4N2_16430 [Hyphomicrobium sp.]
MRWFRRLMALVIVGCLLPTAVSLLAGAIASWHGCPLDLTSAKTCMIAGADWGQTLLTMGMMGYFLFATLPVLLGAMALWFVVEVARVLKRPPG